MFTFLYAELPCKVFLMKLSKIKPTVLLNSTVIQYVQMFDVDIDYSSTTQTFSDTDPRVYIEC